MSTVTETKATDRGRRQEKIGVVVSSKMDKTVVVEVEKTITHRLYHRYQKRTSKFYAHDEKNEAKPGDTVRIVESRPLSRLKRWKLVEVLKKAGEI